jgi:hypothetical protein
MLIYPEAPEIAIYYVKDRQNIHSADFLLWVTSAVLVV